MADRRPVETLVERDDRVVFTMRAAGGGAELPHDLVHALVEEALGVADGVWGCVADASRSPPPGQLLSSGTCIVSALALEPRGSGSDPGVAGYPPVRRTGRLRA